LLHFIHLLWGARLEPGSGHGTRITAELSQLPGGSISHLPRRGLRSHSCR
jgi:hypothetical protein